MISMESRTEKYKNDIIPSRSARNARLYKEVYGKYDELNNLPLEDNTDEIDMNRLQEILHANEPKKENINEVIERQNIGTIRKRNIDENKLYDINKILEKAKYENNKLKETTPLTKIDTKILSTLENREVSLDEINKSRKEEVKNTTIEDDLSMTRELKFKGLSKEVDSNPLIENVMPNSDLSLDLFDDLKGTENTITTKPIKEADAFLKPLNEKPKINPVPEKIDFHSGDTRDIDIIKTEPIKKDDKTNDFFTSSYEFSD